MISLAGKAIAGLVETNGSQRCFCELFLLYDLSLFIVMLHCNVFCVLCTIKHCFTFELFGLTTAKLKYLLTCLLTYSSYHQVND